MGDIANWTNSQEDYLGDECYWPGNTEPYERPRTFQKCNRCNAGFLHWENFTGRWTLFSEDGKPHACSEFPSQK